MRIESVSSPSYSAADNSAIDCVVKFAELPVPVPFTARVDDSEKHGRDLYAALVAGTYGAVAAYVAPPDAPRQPTIQDIIDVLPQDSLDALSAKGFSSAVSAVPARLQGALA